MKPRKRKSKQKHPKIKELPFSYSRIQKTDSISKTLSFLTLKKVHANIIPKASPVKHLVGNKTSDISVNESGVLKFTTRENDCEDLQTNELLLMLMRVSGKRVLFLAAVFVTACRTMWSSTEEWLCDTMARISAEDLISFRTGISDAWKGNDRCK